MKYHLLFNTLEGPARPRFKCGKDFERQKKLNQMSMDFQQQENDKDRHFNSSEAEKQRQWQSAEWLNQYETQRDEWYNQLEAQKQLEQQMFDYQSEYNSPANQLKRLNGIGLNPSALLSGQGSSGLVSAATGNVSSAPSPSVPNAGAVSGASAHNQSNSTPNINTNPFSDYSAFGSFLKDLSDVFSQSAELRPQIKQLMSSVTKNYADAELSNVTAEGQRIFNYIQDRVKDTSVKKYAADLENTYVDTMVKRSLTGVYDEDILLKKAETLLTKAKEKCSSEEYNIIAFNVAHLFETWKTDINLKKAQTGEARAQAYQSTTQGNLNISLKATEDEMRQWRVANEEYVSNYNWSISKLSHMDWKVRDNSLELEIKTNANALLNKLEQDNMITENMYQQLQHLIQQNDWYGFNQVMGAVTGTVQSGAIMYGIGRMAGGAVPIKGFRR